VLVSAAHAQPDSPPATPDQPTNGQPESEPKKRVEEVGTKTYHIYDESGQLRVAFKGITFEELNRRLKELDNLKSAPPSYLIQQLSITGKVERDFAELTCEFEIKNLEQSDTDFVRIPFKMAGALLPAGDSLQYEGPGDVVLQSEVNNQGLSGWLRGGAGQLHKLKVKVLIPVIQLGDENHLRVHFPRANRSQLKLALPGSDIVADVRSGGFKRPEEPAGETTVVPVDHLTGDFQLAWRDAGSQPMPTSRALEVEGVQRITIEGNQVRTHANLKVASRGMSFRDFQITLPHNARLVADDDRDKGYKIVLQTDGAPENAEPQKADVVLDEPTAGPISIQIETLTPFQLQRVRTIDLTGFIVNEAVRHSGHIGVQMGVGGDYKVRWVESSYQDRFDIKRVDKLPEPWQSDRLEGAFQYFSQSYQLKAEISAPTTRIVVDPEYLVSISKDHADLTARLKYQIRGGSIDSVELDLKQWTLDADSITPVDNIDLPEMTAARRIKLRFTRPIKGQLEISFRARREISSDAKAFSFGIPTLAADSVRETKVAVLPDDNILLTPQLMPSPAAIATSFNLPERQQAPYYFEYARADAIPEAFGFGFRDNPLVISADVESSIQIAEDAIRVRQVLQFEILHQTVSSIDLVVPTILAGRDELISRNSTPVELAKSPDENVESEESVRMSVSLDDAIGPVQLVAQFEIPLGSLPTDTQLTQFVPLAMPLESHLRRNRVQISVHDKLQFEMADAAFRPVKPVVDPLDDNYSYYQSEQSTSRMAMLVGRLPQQAVGSVDVRRAWIQTWLSTRSRDELAVLRLHCRATHCEIRLPQGVVPEQTWILLDGQPQAPIVVNQALRVALPNDNGEHVLVLRYFRDVQSAEWERASIDMPQIVGGSPIKNVYWQLVLPQTEHLLESPATCTTAFEWQWRRFGWHRVPRLDDPELMSWIGHFDAATAKLPTAVSGSANSHVYLMRFQSLPVNVSLATASRTWLVLMSMGSVLFVGLLLLYVPVARKSGVLFALAICVFAVGFLYPEAARIIAQIGLFGAGLVLISVVMRLGAIWNRPIKVEPAPGSSVRYSTTEAFQPQGAMAVPSSSTVIKPVGMSGSIATPES
jgi:hypothetical protein